MFKHFSAGYADGQEAARHGLERKHVKDVADKRACEYGESYLFDPWAKEDYFDGFVEGYYYAQSL